MQQQLVTWRHSVMRHFCDVAANGDTAAISNVVAIGDMAPFNDGVLLWRGALS